MVNGEGDFSFEIIIYKTIFFFSHKFYVEVAKKEPGNFAFSPLRYENH